MSTIAPMVPSRLIAGLIAGALVVVVDAAPDLEVVGPPKSLHARTIVVHDDAAASGEWSVDVDSAHACAVVTGSPAAGDAPDEVEIPFLVLIPEDGAAKTVATVTVSRGELVVEIQQIVIVRSFERSDINRDGRVDSADLAAILAAWGPCQPGSACAADLDRDGVVDGRDLSVLVGSWRS